MCRLITQVTEFSNTFGIGSWILYFDVCILHELCTECNWSSLDFGRTVPSQKTVQPQTVCRSAFIIPSLWISTHPLNSQYVKMAEDEEIAALVIDNGSGMCKGM